MGGAPRVAEGWTTGQGMPRGGEAQAVEELQRTCTDLQRRLESVERAEREGKRPREQAQESWVSPGRPLLQPFRQPAIAPEMETEMQERASRRMRGEAAKLVERERRAGEVEGPVARGAHRVLPDPEGDTPSTDVEGQAASGKGARGERGEAGQARGKRRRVEERGAVEASGGLRPTSPSPV